MKKKIFENQEKTFLLQHSNIYYLNIQKNIRIQNTSVKVSFHDEREREILFSRELVREDPQVGWKRQGLSGEQLKLQILAEVETSVSRFKSNFESSFELRNYYQSIQIQVVRVVFVVLGHQHPR